MNIYQATFWDCGTGAHAEREIEFAADTFGGALTQSLEHLPVLFAETAVKWELVSVADARFNSELAYGRISRVK